ncbi:MAG: large conductance mechanosensitive channel protein MscL [Microbacteriaceae bacterium]|nr:large conductance mechanosensitive channel protein MscL [Microbacteriaceae bacterium]
MIKGFRDFIARGNVIDLAVAVVIGAAFGAVVTAVVDALINPLISALLGGADLSQALVVEIPTVAGGTASLSFGAVIGALINFLAIAFVVYLCFVLPMNKWRERQARKNPVVEEAPAPTETELLAEIRDLLAKR